LYCIAYEYEYSSPEISLFWLPYVSQLMTMTVVWLMSLFFNYCNSLVHLLRIFFGSKSLESLLLLLPTLLILDDQSTGQHKEKHLERFLETYLTSLFHSEKLHYFGTVPIQLLGIAYKGWCSSLKLLIHQNVRVDTQSSQDKKDSIHCTF
jgi:hypothetical protein